VSRHRGRQTFPPAELLSPRLSPLASLPSRTPIPAVALARSAHIHLTACPHLLSHPRRPSAPLSSRAAKEGICVRREKLVKHSSLDVAQKTSHPPHMPTHLLQSFLRPCGAPISRNTGGDRRVTTAKRKGKKKRQWRTISAANPARAVLSVCVLVFPTCSALSDTQQPKFVSRLLAVDCSTHNERQMHHSTTVPCHTSADARSTRKLFAVAFSTHWPLQTTHRHCSSARSSLPNERHAERDAAPGHFQPPPQLAQPQTLACSHSATYIMCRCRCWLTPGSARVRARAAQPQKPGSAGRKTSVRWETKSAR
jgi:hypothetical protein